MHSMSSQFYRYLSKKLINYFKSNLHAGDKFFVQFDEENQVEIFYNTLKNSNNFDLSVSVEEFVYKHDMGNEFKTYALSVGNIKLVVASSLDVNVDYLVTLRNQVVTQEGVWKDCALLIICYESIDSICEGMRDLESKGLPFDVNLISKNLVSEIEESKELSKVNKEITKFYLSKKEEDLFQTNLWDYEEILSILDNGKIDREDYVKLGLFPDEELKEFPNVRSIRSRLSENSDMYEDVKIIKNSGDSKSKLEKKFDSIGVKALNDDENWSFVDFKLLKKSAESLKKNKKTLLYIENNNKFTNEGLTYWEKAKSHTAAGQRTRYILIFNNQDLDSVSLDFSFDGRVYAANLIKKPDYVTAAGKKLKVAFNLNSEKLTSKKFVYEHNKSKFTFFIIVVPAKESFFESIKHRYSITGSAKKLKITVTNDENDEEVSFGEGHIVKEMEVDSNDNLILNSHELSQYKIIISENSPENVVLLENWLRSYHPEELFDENGTLLPELKALTPTGNRRMGSNPHANGGMLLEELRTPDFREYGVDVTMPGEVMAQDLKELGRYIRDVVALNEDKKNFRIFGPDEALSNRLNYIFEKTNRQFNANTYNSDEFLANEGRVLDSYLSEHACEGWLEGYLLTGRHGFFHTYEAFARIIDSMASQHAKWLKVTSELPWRRPIASLNYILSSHIWQQDHNGYTHQDPGFLSHLVTKKADIVRMY